MEQTHLDSVCCSQSQGARHDDCDLDHDGSRPELGHTDTHVCDTSGSRLLVTLALNLLIPAVQVIGGIQAHSMALISDAAHNFSDFTAVLIAYIANRIGRKGASIHNTFGYRRAEILAAAINVGLLAGVAAFIVYQAIDRLRHPEAVVGQLVIIVAGIGVLGNGLSAFLLHRDAGHNLNVRGAFLHMLGDLFTSVVVLLNGIILIYKPWYWMDAVLSILIAVFIGWNCWTILKKATAILMNSTPAGLDINRVKNFIEQIPGISGVHYVHAWNVCSSSVAFSCHVVVPDQHLSSIDALSERIRGQLSRQFGIDHPILQFEATPCGEPSLLCALSRGGAESAEEHSQTSWKKAGAFFRKPLVFWVRLILGAVFVFASADKILHPAAFAQLIANYQILPGALINICAIVLPWVELLLGCFLVFGVWLPGAVALLNLLLISFFGSLIFNLARGLNVHCGCFTTSTQGDPATAWYLVRDGVFLLMGAYLFFKYQILTFLRRNEK